MSKNNRIHFIVIFFSILAFSSCSNINNGIKVGFMLPYSTSTRFPIEQKYFEAKAKELGYEVLVTDAKSDDKTQIEQAKELIDKGAKVLVVISVNGNTAASIIREAHNAGVKVIAYDRLISNCDLDFYISFNNYNVGKYMTEYALKQKPEGKYFLLGGDKADRNAIIVRNGIVETLKPSVTSGKVKIVYDVYTEDWSSENAYVNVRKYLKLSSMDVPDVFISSYDGLTYGAIQAINEFRIPNDILLTGQDAEPQALKNIAQGRQTMTIYKSLKVLAENAAIIASKVVKNEKIDTTTSTYNGRISVPTILFDPVVVDKSNLKQTVVADGVIKEEELYK